MRMNELILKIGRLEKRLAALEDENRRLREIEVKYEELVKENGQLKETLKQYADAAASKKPKFGLNYSSERNEPKDKSQRKRNKTKNKNPRKPAGRKPKTHKPEQADHVESIYPEGVSPKKCVFVREQFVWRLIGHEAKYVHYKIFDLPDSKSPPTIPGVRDPRCEYGLEFLMMLAHHVYWLGLSMDKARQLIEFYTELKISKSQADTLLYQLARDWQSEYKEIAKRIAEASILYIDETAWKLGRKACYTWVFGTFADVYYRCGVGRGKDILTEVLGEKFKGIGISDDYAGYDSIFSQHQLCWAHFLRKAIELMLRYPTERKYRNFYLKLLLIYRKAKRYQNDGRLSNGRDAKVLELQTEITKLCKRVKEEIITEKHAKANGWDVSWITPEPERKMILLQRELVENLNCLFVFVANPEVGSTNNQSERDLRDEAQARKAGRTSKTAKGAKRRGVIISVFATLKRRMEHFTLTNLLNIVFEAQASRISLFKILKPPNQKMTL